MAETSRAKTIAHLKAWLASARPDATSEAFDEDTDLIETRVLPSLQLVEFVLFIEELSGRSVLTEALRPEQLRTLARIHEEFFEERAGG